MAITRTVDNGDELQQAFHEYGRGDQFSNDGFDWLFDILDEMETELDVIGVCCDVTEYDPDEFNKQIPDDRQEEFTELINGNYIGWNI